MRAKRVRNDSPAAAVISPESGGCLYLVGTPIGNLEDITLRALRILKEVDLIACEDTRHTQKLLNHYDIRKSLVSYHEHNEMTRSSELLIQLEDGAKIALVSDAGMPLVSDPGYRLVTLCVRHKIPVVPVPGPSALLAALAASGLPNEEFLFVGFPREVTKLHEEFRRGKLSELAASLARVPARGEITLLVGPLEANSAGLHADTSQSLSDRVEELIRQAKLDRKEALKLAARERGLTRRAAYEQLVQSKEKPN